MVHNRQVAKLLIINVKCSDMPEQLDRLSSAGRLAEQTHLGQC